MYLWLHTNTSENPTIDFTYWSIFWLYTVFLIGSEAGKGFSSCLRPKVDQLQPVYRIFRPFSSPATLCPQPCNQQVLILFKSRFAGRGSVLEAARKTWTGVRIMNPVTIVANKRSWADPPHLKSKFGHKREWAVKVNWFFWIR